jgi:hypothetical protein
MSRTCDNFDDLFNLEKYDRFKCRVFAYDSTNIIPDASAGSSE